MPKSRVRKKKVYIAPATARAYGQQGGGKYRPSSGWVPGVAVALAVVGMVWLVIFYLTTGGLPIASIGNWNIGIGFSCIIAALVTFTRWR